MSDSMIRHFRRASPFVVLALGGAFVICSVDLSKTQEPLFSVGLALLVCAGRLF